MREGEGAAPGPDDVEAVTHAVLTASRLLVTVSARSLALVEEKVTPPQFRMLAVLSVQGPAKLVLLAERLGVNPSTAMRMVDRLVAAGLVERRINPGNRRETVLRLTPAGRRVVREVTAKRRAGIASIVRRLTPAQRTALVDALGVLAEAGDEPVLPDTGARAGHHPWGWTDVPVAGIP